MCSRFLLCVFVLALQSSAGWGACTGSSPTWTSTPDSASVGSCVRNAQNGDTINVSSGSATWTSTVSWNTKGLSIIGAGQGVTTITNSVASSDGAILMEASNTGGNFVRVSGFTFNSSDNQTPVLSFVGPASKVRVDHVTFNKGDAAVGTNHYDSIVRGSGPVYGVVDHCTFKNMKRAYYATDVRVGDSLFGTAAWNEYIGHESTFPGSNKMMFFEDNTFTWDSGLTDTNAQGAVYGGYGGKVCLRHNTFNGFYTYVDAHGDTPDYGTIYYEIYNNTFTQDNTFGGATDIVGMRGGQLIAHDNTFTGSTLPFGMTVYWTTDITSGLGHTVKNTYYFGNSWNGDSVQGDSVAVIDSGQTPAGYSATYIILNQQYFRAAPQSGQTFFAYTPYTYPHPLTNVTSASAPAPPSNLSANVH